MLRARSAAASSSDKSSNDSGSGAAAPRLSPADLGARISLLFRIHGDPEHPFSEAVGVLQKIGPDPGSEDGVIEVVRRNGEVVAIREGDLIKFRILGTA